MMEKDSVQDRIDKGRYGAPSVNPDEKRDYLGTFRERCVLTMSPKEMQDPVYKDYLKKELADHDLQVIMNGDLPSALQDEYITFFAKNGIKFKILDNDETDDEGALGLVVAAKEAVNEPVIDIAEKYS